MPKNKTNKIKKLGLITVDILEGVYFLTENVIGAFERESLCKKLNKKYSEPQVFNNLRSLIERGYIEIIETNNSKASSVRLTNKGKIKLLENRNENEIDGKWRLISFDIPEEKCQDRRRFRLSLKRIGFRQIQKSLWACPFANADQISLVIQEYGLQDYVAYFIIEKTDIENHLNNMFSDVLKS